MRLASRRSPKAAPLANCLVTPARNRDKSQFCCFFLTFSLWENITCTCQSVAWVIFWLTGLDVAVFCLPRCPVCQLVPLLSSLTHSMCCAALLALFQMCAIRKDMKSVQDRLLTQMVSGVDTFGSSALTTLFFCFFFLCPRPSLVHRTIILKSVYECSFFFFSDFLFVFAPFAARGGDPECEEGTACLVLPLTDFSVWPKPREGTTVDARSFYHNGAHEIYHLKLVRLVPGFSRFCLMRLVAVCLTENVI